MKAAALPVVLLLLAFGHLAAQTNVPGTSNPWLAPAASTDPNGDSDAEKPRLANGLGLYAGETLTFAVTGSVAFDGSTPADSPDGEDNYPVTHGAENGLSGVNAPANALVAVFIDPTVPADPTNANAPALLDFFDASSVPGGRNYTTLAPKLNQVFFIGDATTTGGAAQQITVPDGAGALYFGSMDGEGWYNNTGAFSVTVTPVTTTAVPLTPTTFLVNGSNSPSNYFPGAAVVIPAGTPLKFTATQGSSAPGLYVRVQASTTPTVESSWTDITDTTNGGAGFLHADGNGAYSLSTTQVPNGSAEYFRAISAASGYTDSISDFYIGPFDLSGATVTSTAQLRITQKETVNGTQAYTVAQIGDKLTYTYSLTNEGTGTAKGVTVVNHLPSHLRFISADNSYVTSGVSTDGVSGGGTVTWNIGDLPPTYNEPIVLTLVTVITNDAPINSVIANTDYTANGTGLTPAAGVGQPYTTTVKAPLDVEITSNGTSISPGGTLIYSFAIGNLTSSTIKGVALDLPIGAGQKVSTAIFVDQSAQPIPSGATGAATFADVSGRPTVGTPTAKINSSDVLLTIGTLKKGAKAYFQVTVPIPYDADPKAPISLSDAKITTTKAVGGLSQYTLEIAPATLSGIPPVNPPHFDLIKFVPDGSTIQNFIALDSVAYDYFSAAFGGLVSTASIQALGQAVNPYILDSTDDNGAYRQEVLAPGQPNGPAVTSITYALFVTNDGGFSAANVVVTDRVPAGTKFDKASPTLNGAAFDPGAVTIDSDGRTVHFALGTVKAGKPAKNGKPAKPSLALILYTVDVLKASKGGPSLGAAVQAQGGSVSTPSLIATALATPNEIDTYIAAPGAAYIESYKGTPVATIGSQLSYDIYYANTGGIIPTDFQIIDAIPAGTTFVSAELLDKNHVHRDPDGTKGEQAPALFNGVVTYHLGKVKPTKDGWVRLTVTVNDNATGVSGLIIVNSPYVPRTVFPGNPQIAKRGPETRLGSPLLSGAALAAAESRALVQLSDPLAGIKPEPPLPRLSVGMLAPKSVPAGQDFDYLFFAANLSDTTAFGAVLQVAMPVNATFKSASDGAFTNGHYLYFPATENIPGHAAIVRRAKFTANAAAGTPIVSPGAYTTGAFVQLTPGVNTVLSSVYSGPTSTYVYDPATSFADAKSLILSSSLDQAGGASTASQASFWQLRVDSLTPTTYGASVGGGDLVALTNETGVVPLGAGNVLAFGNAANIVAQGGGNIVAQGGGNLMTDNGAGIVAQGGGNLLGAANIVAQGGGNFAGNFQTILSGIVAQGGGNIVAQGGGNLYNAGGLNLISGSNVISNDGGSVFPIGPSLASAISSAGVALVSNSSGTLVSNSSGTLVSNSSGTLVSNSSGTLLSGGAAGLINVGGGSASLLGKTFSSSDASVAIDLSSASAISISGGNVINTNGSNIVAQGGGN